MKSLLALASMLVLFSGSFALASMRHESSLGLQSVSGNAQSSAVSFKHQSEFEGERNRLSLFADLLRASNAGVESAYTWTFGARYGLILGPRYSLMLGEKVEGNRFQGILQRYSTDAGIRYSTPPEAWTFSSELGYRFARENYPRSFQDLHFVRTYVGVERHFTREVIFGWWLEGLPNLTVSRAWQLNSEFSLTTQLAGSFALKTGYQVRHYHQPPPGARSPTDTYFTTSLLAHF